MTVIGITGSIATGKSTVTKCLLQKGYIVLDSDVFARDALDIDDSCIEQVSTLFDCLENEKIDRKKLGKIIFNDKKAKQQLEDIIHPYVIGKLKEGIKKHRNEELIFLDIPLLYESELTYLCDKVVVVYCSEEEQVKRLMNRDNIDIDYAKQMISNQMPIEEKRKRADIVLDNNESIESLYAQIGDRWKGN